nr:PREDICTED: telomere repeats-binding bouquet formation protein 1 isoform X3 [Latimeria chalumnae]|eukprot:XP_014348782.1 PREDICTED: telomere repeats-binding bouquet formation protein 1 isoform X3 [Latimeria chalumnae]
MEHSAKETGKKHCELKTDLNLLLECLKYQMDNPAAQKQALVTIYSICQENGEASDYFREIGGLMFVYNLAKSSAHLPVKEAALFTLGTLAESSVYCQQSLCTSELFAEVGLSLSQKDSSLTLKRMAVYVVLVLVSNNKTGQTFTRKTGCIDLLLNLFRTTFPISENAIRENMSQYYELWSSVSSALCACVNNPQNEENQRICITVFPIAKEWLQKCIRREIIRPICSFVSLTVANNEYAQNYFAMVGGLDALAMVLVKLVDDALKSYLSSELAVMVSKTLVACIAENSALNERLTKYHTVPKLLALLSHHCLDSAGKFSVVLAIGHCTEACEENQYHLLKNNGLPLMIQILTDSQDEELNKAAIFVLQNCRHITGKLSSEHGCDEQLSTTDVHGTGRSVEDFCQKAKEILQRIEMLERQQKEDSQSSFQDIENTTENTTEKTTLPSGQDFAANYSDQLGVVQMISDPCRSLSQEPLVRPRSFQLGDISDLYRKHYLSDGSKMRMLDVTPDVGVYKNCCEQLQKTEDRPRYRDNVLMEKVKRQIFVDNDRIQKPAGTTSSMKKNHRDTLDIAHSQMQQQQNERPISSYASDLNYEHKGTEAPTAAKNSTNSYTVQTEPREGLSSTSKARLEHQRKETCLENGPSGVQESEHTFKHPASFLKSKKQKSSAEVDDFSLCSDIVDDEICNILNTTVSAKIPVFRCSGYLLTPIKRGTSLGLSNISRRHSSQKYQQVLLTPIKKAACDVSAFPDKTRSDIELPLGSNSRSVKSKAARLQACEAEDADTREKHAYSFDEDEECGNPDYHVPARRVKTKRIRKNYTKEEVDYLLEGVKKMGHHWNSILWSYPFQRGRKNADLARKYRNLMMKRKQENYLR